MPEQQSVFRGKSPYLLPVIAFAALLVTDPSGITAVSLLAAVIHEIGHLVAAYLLHIPLRGFFADFTGVRIIAGGRVLSYGEEWLLCAAGPLSSLLFAAVAAPLWGKVPLAGVFSCASLILGILNLLPVESFDGGRMLLSTLRQLVSERTAGVILAFSSFLSLFFLWAVALYFLLRAGDGISLFFFSISLISRLLSSVCAKNGKK